MVRSPLRIRVRFCAIADFQAVDKAGMRHALSAAHHPAQLFSAGTTPQIRRARTQRNNGCGAPGKYGVRSIAACGNSGEAIVAAASAAEASTGARSRSVLTAARFESSALQQAGAVVHETAVRAHAAWVSTQSPCGHLAPRANEGAASNPTTMAATRTTLFG